LGDRQAAGIAGFVLAVHDGRAEPDAVEDVLRSLVDTR
jgi:hypothetical protein